VSKKIYLSFHNSFFDSIIKRKRIEILKIIKSEIKKIYIKTCLDIGTTSDFRNKSSNFIIKNLKGYQKYFSISDQKIIDIFFTKSLKKSITAPIKPSIMKKFKSDLVLSSATIEHVGSRKNQLKMFKNISLLTKKIFIITTPNKSYPIDFHTKLPLLHFFPDYIYRKILKILRFDFFSEEKNLNLLSFDDIKFIIEKLKLEKSFHIKIKFIKLLFLKSNFIIIGRKKN